MFISCDGDVRNAVVDKCRGPVERCVSTWSVICVVVVIFQVIVVCGPVSVDGRQSSWWGRTCCELSMVSRCKRTCLKARSRDDLTRGCNPANEPSLSMCLDRQAAGNTCCRTANDDHCRVACKSVFIADAQRPSNRAVRRVMEHCNQPVTSCVANYTATVAWNQLSDESVCCDSGETEVCQTNCRRALLTSDSEDEALNEVVKYCGEAPLWQCFLHGSRNRLRHQFVHGGTIDVTGVDSAKLSCCSRATTSRCRQLCLKTYGTQWADNINDFNNQCSFSLQEKELNICLDEVDDPCQVGCSGLSYCTNFNHRPTETFRSCNRLADDSARRTVKTWEQNGVISMPELFGFDIPIKDIRTCEPSTWKAISCLIHVQPCRVMSTTPLICRSDCVKILSRCLDTTRVPPGVTAAGICDQLSTPDDGSEQHCLHLSPYLVDSPHQSTYAEVSTPCSSNPCQANQVCIINRDRCSYPSSLRSGGNVSSCLPYICKPGCPLGEVHSQLVPQNTFARIVSGETGTGCHRKCKCSGHGLLHQCRDVTCIAEEQCFLVGGIYNHNSRFNNGPCQKCFCFAGEVICTKRQCVVNGNRNSMLTRALPCNCPSSYAPVCSANGRTYPNSCIARCQGFSDAQFSPGACVDKDPCQKNPCPADQRCIALRHVCLVNIQKSDAGCRNFECVTEHDHCERSRYPVCDNSAENHPSVCAMLSRNRQLAYFGRCQSSCSSNGTVCGVDGETYSSECVAWMAGGVLTDYKGPCRTTAPLSDDTLTSTPCLNVVCTPSKTMGCSRPVLPPGACCPICAGEIRALVSGLLASQASYSYHAVTPPGGVIGSSISSVERPLTVGDVVDAIRQLVRVKECYAFGYLSIESEVVLIVAPVTELPTHLQVNACVAETERLGALLTTSGPVVAVSPALSTLVAIDVRIPRGSPGGVGLAGWPHHDQPLVPGAVETGTSRSSSSLTACPCSMFDCRCLRTLMLVVIGVAITTSSLTSGFNALC